jgi:hypothetical protein
MDTRKETMRGNQNAVKLVSIELKLEAYADYCAHIAKGLSKKSWYFKDESRLLCTYQTLEKYMKEDENVFQPIHKEIADCKSLGHWEKKGMDMMDGVINSEPALYQIFMRNKFDWDKPDKSISAEETRSDLKTYASAMKQARPEQPQVQSTDHSDSQASE